MFRVSLYTYCMYLYRVYIDIIHRCWSLFSVYINWQKSECPRRTKNFGRRQSFCEFNGPRTYLFAIILAGLPQRQRRPNIIYCRRTVVIVCCCYNAAVVYRELRFNAFSNFPYCVFRQCINNNNENFRLIYHCRFIFYFFFFCTK